MKYAIVTAIRGGRNRLKTNTMEKSISATVLPTVQKRINLKTLCRFNTAQFPQNAYAVLANPKFCNG